MTQAVITPDQIKTIASGIRRIEQDRLGSKLPNTTALNAITRALGLGEDFRSYQASYDRPRNLEKPQAAKGESFSKIVFAFYAELGEDVLGNGLLDELLGDVQEDGWLTSVEAGLHGFARLVLWKNGVDISPYQMSSLRARCRRHLERLEEEVGAPALAYYFDWQAPEADRRLIVNIEHQASGLLSSLTVSEQAWLARNKTDLNDEEFCLLVCQDGKIPREYRADDIIVRDVILSSQRDQEP